MTAVISPQPGIMDITPYVGGESAIPGVERIIKLASNEGALGPSPRAVAALRETAPDVFRYPDGGCHALRGAIGERFGLDPARIVCGAGSDELIGLLCRAYAGAGDEVLYTEHGFLMYPIAARTAGATPVTAAETNLTADVDKLLAAVTADTRIVFIANPNNPTGTYLCKDELARLRAGLPAGVLLVLDAAYAEYMEHADYTAGESLVDAGDNVVMTRTFSKIFGLGGARLGWAYCPPAIADVLNRVRNPFNVTSAAQAAGVAALGDVAFMERARAHNTEWRTWFSAAGARARARGAGQCLQLRARALSGGGRARRRGRRRLPEVEGHHRAAHGCLPAAGLPPDHHRTRGRNARGAGGARRIRGLRNQ